MYHNNTLAADEKDKDNISSRYDMINPTIDMLKDALGIDSKKIHTFGDFSLGQILEKFNWLTGLGLKYNKKNALANRAKYQLLVVMVSLGEYCLLTEIDQKQKESYEKMIEGRSIKLSEQAKDGTELHKNFVSVLAFTKNKENNEKKLVRE